MCLHRSRARAGTDTAAFERHSAVLQWWCELLEWALQLRDDCAWPAVPRRQRVAALLLWNPIEVVRAACEDTEWRDLVREAPEMMSSGSAAGSATDILRFMADKKRPEWSVESERVAATLHVCMSLDRAYALDGSEAAVRMRCVALVCNAACTAAQNATAVFVACARRPTALQCVWRAGRGLSLRSLLTVSLCSQHLLPHARALIEALVWCG